MEYGSGRADKWTSVSPWLLGSYNQSAGATWPLHSTKYVLDEEVLHKGVAMHVGYAMQYLASGFKL
jgi:IAA-amino acid hydrolase